MGDVSDYLKYATLRAWSRVGLVAGLVWMLTAGDARSDGGLTGYLHRARTHRDFDPELFDGLERIVAEGRRSVRAVMETGLLGGAFSYESRLGDGPSMRASWFDGLAERSCDAPVLFFDPDNGLEIASVARGRSGSCRYLFLNELASLARPDQAVCVYQHFPRVARAAYLDIQLARLAAAWPGGVGFAVCSSRIALLVSAPASIGDQMLRAARAVVDRDAGRMGSWLHEPSPLLHPPLTRASRLTITVDANTLAELERRARAEGIKVEDVAAEALRASVHRQTHLLHPPRLSDLSERRGRAPGSGATS